MMNVTRIWRTTIRHRSVVLGAILASLVWMALSFFLANEHDSAERAAVQNSTNLAGAFEEHLSRSLSEIDRSLKIIRTLQARDPARFSLADWLKSNRVLTNDVLQITLVDREGNVKVGGVEGVAQALSDSRLSEAFKAHADTLQDHLFIGKPVLDPATGRWSLQLSRRINDSHGLFNGVIVAALDPAYLTRIYDSVNIGKDGYIRVIGLDGAVRATSGRTFSILGRDFSGADLFKKLSSGTNGWYYTGSALSDNAKRLIAYRSVTNYPVVITVGVAAHEIFSRFEAQKQSGYLTATALSLLILIVTVLSVRGQFLRDSAKKRLEHANMLLNATLANMPHGICMFGADKRLVLANDLYSTMYGLDPDKIKPGTTLPQILDARVASGCSPKDTQKYIADRMAEAFHPDSGYFVNELQDGRTLAVSRRPMPDGGSVAVHQDITAHLLAEKELDETKQFLNSIIENIPIAVVVKDANTRKFILVNRTFEAMIKVSRVEVLGKTVFEIYRPKDAERIDADDNEALTGGLGAHPSQYEIEMPGGESRILATNRLVVRDSQAIARHLVVVIDDITERKKSEQRIAFMAHHDVLTGLQNRLSIMEKIEEAIARHRRRGGTFDVMVLV